MDDWEINPDSYQKDSDGNFILKIDGTPKKKGGRTKGSKSRGYHYSRATQNKIAARKAVRTKEKLIAKAEAKIKNQKTSLKTSKATLAKIENREKSSEGKILTADVVEDLPNLSDNTTPI